MSTANCYLEIKGVTGTSTIFKGAIEISSFSWGVHSAAAGAQSSGETRQGKPHFSEMSIMKNVDPSSPILLRHLCTNDPFTEAHLVFMKQIASANVPYFKIDLKKVYIASMQVSAGGDAPMESITLEYETITFGYAAEKPDKKGVDGFVEHLWDLKTNK